MTFNNAIYGVDIDLSYVKSRGRQVADLKTRNGDIVLRGSTGQEDLVANYDNLRQAIAIRFGTPRGTLRTHPQFGSDLYRLIGEPIVQHILELLRVISAQSLLEEPRVVSVDAVDVAAASQSLVNVTFTLTPAASSQPLNLVYPFDLGAETE